MSVKAETKGKGATLLTFACLGIVYGDIGTSPLYTLRACFSPSEGAMTMNPANVLGILSVLFWSLILIVSIEYLVFVLRADNDGEGGILALMSLALAQLAPKSAAGRVVATLGLFGTALIYGDGIITPAISVLGAMDGLKSVAPAFERFVVPISVAVLVTLFMLQRRGTAGVAALFAPVMLIWFSVIGYLGLMQIIRDPSVLAALNPLCAIRFFIANGHVGFVALGFVFLAVTGCEALYADMGHFGKMPIRLAWFFFALPGLLLNYFGQGALLLAEPAAVDHLFFELAPRSMLYPLIALATAAAVVASQALISGAFSLSRQAVQLGYLPRLSIIHTSKMMAGQIYVPSVNIVLMIFSIALVILFKTPGALASAYGIAIAIIMVITISLFSFVALRVFAWRRWQVAILAIVFLGVNLCFLGAVSTKFLEGGWVSLTFALVVYVMMSCWREGRDINRALTKASALPIDLLLADLGPRNLPRVEGTAVFLNSDTGIAPLVLLHHLKHNKVLHQRVVLLSIVTESTPFVAESERATMTDLGQGVFQVLAHYGFMESPNVPHVLAGAAVLGADFAPLSTTYYLGRHTLFPTGKSAMWKWRKQIFCFLQRNSRPATDYFGLPPNRVIEIGAHVHI